MTRRLCAWCGQAPRDASRRERLVKKCRRCGGRLLSEDLVLARTSPSDDQRFPEVHRDA